MAIVKMKKLRVVAMADRREELLEGLLHLGCVEITEPDNILKEPGWESLLQRESSRLVETKNEIAAVNTALAALKKYAQAKDGFFIQRRAISAEELMSEDLAVQADAASGRILEFLQELTQLQSDETRLSAQKAALMPWASLDMPLESGGTEHTRFFMGTFPGGTDMSAIQTELAASDTAAELYQVSVDKQLCYAFLICHKEDNGAVLETLRPYGFSVTDFPDLSGTPAENLGELERLLGENKNRQDAAAAGIIGMAEKKELLQTYLDRLNAEECKDSNAERLLTDGTILFFAGWAPAEKLEAVQVFLEKLDCAWEAEDPSEEDYPSVPVQLKNNWLTKPLNMVTEMYSLPAYDNVDPNPLMAPFFILFYGIMMADMGYGLLMILAGLLIGKKYRPKGTMGHLFGLLTLCGVSTFIMGAITGGFFGDFLTQVVLLTTGKDFALPALFTPLNDTLMILIGAVALGLVQIVTGMAISFVRKLKRGAVLDAIFEEVTWWLVFAGIGCMVLLKNNLVLYAGLALVVLGPVVTGKGMGKVIGIFSSIYNHVTGYFGDLLSYARLMALMLAGSVIAQVFNTLGAIPGNIFIFLIISVAGNTLNFALNLLGCYVHDLRLQCLEYFGKFYEDGGKPFRPFAMNTKYLDIEKTI